MVYGFQLLLAVSRTFSDFKPYLFCERGVAGSLKKCLQQLLEPKMNHCGKSAAFFNRTFWILSVPDGVSSL